MLSVPVKPPKLEVVSEPIIKLRKGTLLKDAFPDIYREIHPTMNPGIDFEKLTYGATVELYWLCSKKPCVHHVWKARVSSRTWNVRRSKAKGHDSSGCPNCAGKETCHCDSFATRYPAVFALFDLERNPDVNPYNIACQSHERLNWQCPDAECDCHIWDLNVCDMTRTFDLKERVLCPFCSGQRTCPHDSFPIKYPKIFEQFDWEANPGIDPYEISYRSHQNLNWKCLEAQCSCHRFNNRVDVMTVSFDSSGDYVCRFCAGHEICPHDSVKARCPELVAEYVPELNPGIDLEKISTGSDIKVIWKCLVDPSHPNWRAQICSRARYNKTGCPTCNESKLEKTCRVILQKHGIVYEHQWEFLDCKHIQCLPFDFYLPQIRILIEVDGKQHFVIVNFNGNHDPNRLVNIQRNDNIKNEYTRKNNIHLLRISYSEKERLEEHIINFIHEVKNSPTRVERFIGKEYQAPAQLPVPAPTQSPVRLLLVQP